MGGNEFGRGAVSTHQARISETSFRQASVMTGRMPVSPSRESFSPTGRAANPASFRNAPSSSQHFSTGGSRGQSVSGGNRNPGSFESPSQINNSGRANSQSSRPGWQTFSSPQSSGSRSSQGFGASNQATVNNSSRGSSAQPENRSSWQHFTPPSSASRGTSSNSYPRTPLTHEAAHRDATWRIAKLRIECAKCAVQRASRRLQSTTGKLQRSSRQL